MLSKQETVNYLNVSSMVSLLAQPNESYFKDQPLSAAQMYQVFYATQLEFILIPFYHSTNNGLLLLLLLLLLMLLLLLLNRDERSIWLQDSGNCSPKMFPIFISLFWTHFAISLFCTSA